VCSPGRGGGPVAAEGATRPAVVTYARNGDLALWSNPHRSSGKPFYSRHRHRRRHDFTYRQYGTAAAYRADIRAAAHACSFDVGLSALLQSHWLRTGRLCCSAACGLVAWRTGRAGSWAFCDGKRGGSGSTTLLYCRLTQLPSKFLGRLSAGDAAQLFRSEADHHSEQFLPIER